MPAIITMALAISLIVTILEMLNGFMSTDENLLKMLKTFGATRLQVFCKIVFPANIPNLINAFKVNIGLCMVGVITGEFLVSKGGLGHLIVYGGQDECHNSCYCSLCHVSMCFATWQSH